MTAHFPGLVQALQYVHDCSLSWLGTGTSINTFLFNCFFSSGFNYYFSSCVPFSVDEGVVGNTITIYFIPNLSIKNMRNQS
jgi:hypothetical protein